MRPIHEKRQFVIYKVGNILGQNHNHNPSVYIYPPGWMVLTMRAGCRSMNDSKVGLVSQKCAL